MKSSIKGFFVILAIVMSFVLVQGDWARADILIEELSGTAISVDNREIGLDMDEDGTIDVTVSHMGPQRYWEDYGLSYPGPGADLIIKDEIGRTPLVWAQGVFLATHAPQPKPSSIALLKRLLGETEKEETLVSSNSSI